MAVNPIIRLAESDDLDALMALEEATFSMDRLSRRAMRHALRSAAQMVIVAFDKRRLIAAAIVGFRAGSDKARLSSIAVAADQGGKGLGQAVLRAAERMAAQRDTRVMRLEVRADNATAIRLYERCGYSIFGRYDDYYEDGAAALRFEKIIA